MAMFEAHYFEEWASPPDVNALVGNTRLTFDTASLGRIQHVACEERCIGPRCDLNLIVLQAVGEQAGGLSTSCYPCHECVCFYSSSMLDQEASMGKMSSMVYGRLIYKSIGLPHTSLPRSYTWHHLTRTSS